MDKELRKFGIHQLEDFQQLSSGWNYSDSYYLQLINSEVPSFEAIKQRVEGFHSWSVQLLDSYRKITKEFIPNDMLVGSSTADVDSTRPPAEGLLLSDIPTPQIVRTSRLSGDVQPGDYATTSPSVVPLQEKQIPDLGNTESLNNNSFTANSPPTSKSQIFLSEDHATSSIPVIQLQEKQILDLGNTESLSNNSFTADSPLIYKAQMLLNEDHDAVSNGGKSAAALHTIASSAQKSALEFKPVGNLSTFANAYHAQTQPEGKDETAVNETTEDSTRSARQRSEVVNPQKASVEVKSASQLNLNQASTVALPNANDSLAPVLGEAAIIDQLLTELSEKVRNDYLRFYSD